MVGILGVASVPYFAFIAVISYVLLDHFAVSYGFYNVLYLLFCLVTIVAPYVYAAASKRVHGSTVLKACIGLTALSGVLLGLFGLAGPLVFLAAFVPATLAEGVIRPMSYVVLAGPAERPRGRGVVVLALLVQRVHRRGDGHRHAAVDELRVRAWLSSRALLPWRWRLPTPGACAGASWTAVITTPARRREGRRACVGCGVRSLGAACELFTVRALIACAHGGPQLHDTCGLGSGDACRAAGCCGTCGAGVAARAARTLRGMAKTHRGKLP